MVGCKRLFDVCASALGLVFLSPFFAVVALLIKMESRGPVFFRQERVGMKFRLFRICKFRTMVQDAPLIGRAVTAGRDPRITRIGHLLRQMKIDELPQLINVFRGEMSLVGPRPEIPHYVDLFLSDFEDILSIRPGITDLASLKYRDEQKILDGQVILSESMLREFCPTKLHSLRSTFVSPRFCLMSRYFSEQF